MTKSSPRPVVPPRGALSVPVILVALLAASACQGSTPPPGAAKPDAADPVLAAGAGAATAPRPAAGASPGLTAFPAVDTSRLDPAGRAFFEKVANEEVCPCDCPKSFGQCLQEGTQCKPAVILAEWIVKNLEGGVAPESLQEQITRELTGGFPSPQKTLQTQGWSAKGANSPSYAIVEFADFECAHCRAVAPVIDELVKTRPEVRVTYKHYPLPFHAMARTAAIAAEAAGRQGKFWEMHAAIFATQDLLSDDLLKGHAKALGLDVPRFLKDFADPELAKKVDGSRAEGQSLGVEFTPYFFVNGRPFFLARSLEAFDVRFRMEDARATSSCQ
jgi:protein-disulfide isomerase